MRKQVHIALAVLLVAVLVVFAWQILRFREPVYGGKPLSVWLEQYGTNHWAAPNSELDKQAEVAIRQIGTNALPICLEMMRSKESSLTKLLSPRFPNRWWTYHYLGWLTEYERKIGERRRLGAYGIALGPDAKSAVPALVALLNDKHPDVRYVSVFALRSLGPVASEALPSMIKCLKDPEFTVQSDAILGLGEIHQESERVIPLLVDLLDKPQNPQHSVILRADAIWALRQFGAEAKPAVPSLVRLLHDEHEGIRSDATNALMVVDPEAAAQAGVK